MTDEDRAINRAHWEELAALHPETEFYDVDAFRDGETTLDWIEREGVGDVTGERLLHLQCHFGLDTLSWAREGASQVVGVDFSETAVETARDLAASVGLADRATFVESDVATLGETLDRRGAFDVVFTSYGVVNWLPDLDAWAETVATFLRPGGRFFVAELHPISHVLLDLSVDDDGTIRSDWPYFGDDPVVIDEQGSYADPDADLDNTVTHEWSHSLGEVVTALVDAGLVLDDLTEYPVASFEQFPGRMCRREDGHWEVPGEDYPLTFSLRAHRPEG